MLLPRVLAGCPDNEAIPPSILRALCSIRFARLAKLIGNAASQLLRLPLGIRAIRYARAAIATCILVVFSPNLIAHGTLATDDGSSRWASFCLYFSFVAICYARTIRNACLSEFTLAMAQLTKTFCNVSVYRSFSPCCFSCQRSERIRCHLY